MCTPSPLSAFRYAGSVAMRVLPSPVRISAIIPLCRAMPPISCTSKWRIFSVRSDASRTTAKASGQQLIQARPGLHPGPELLGLGAQLLVRQRLDLGFELVGGAHVAAIAADDPLIAAAENTRKELAQNVTL